MRLRAVSVLVTALLTLSGCGSASDDVDDPSTKGKDMTPLEQLLARPTTEQAVAMYKDQLVRIRTALKRLAPDVAWDDAPPLKTRDNSCREPFGDVDGAGVFGYATGGGGAIPDQDWDKAIKTTGAILEKEGYDRVKVTVNKPGQHDVSFYGQYGNVLTISGQRSTSIELDESGCFLSAEAHAAAAKSPSPSPGS